MVAADPKIPFGTIIYLPALDYRTSEARKMPPRVYEFLAKNRITGRVVVEDRGRAIKGKNLDLFVGEDRRFAFEFGVRELKGYILNDIHALGKEKRAAD